MMRTRLPRPSRLVFFAAVAVTLIVGMQRGAAVYDVYQPPAGWNRIHTASGLAVWLHPGDQAYKQNISVLAEHYSGTLSEYTALTVSTARSQGPGVEIGGVQNTTVCRTHPSTYLTYAANVHGKLLIYEQMATIWRGIAYLATYTRRADQPSLAEARHSLTTLCGGPPPAQGNQMRPALPGPQPSPSVTPTPVPYPSPIPPGIVVPTVTPRLGP